MQTQERPGYSPGTLSPTKPSDWTCYEPGVGFLPLTGREVPYDDAYFQKYKQLSQTAQGLVITSLRAELVERWFRNLTILDVGIGCGAFIEEMHSRKHVIDGTDVNPVALEWLRANKRLMNPNPIYEVLTFWDVLEHIPEPEKLFQYHTPRWIFLSMPIYKDENHMLTSKHYKPGEHCWYFTEAGLRHFMGVHGYKTIEINYAEVELGKREDIGSFAFKRIE